MPGTHGNVGARIEFAEGLYELGLAFELALLQQHRKRRETRVEGHAHDFLRFRNKHAGIGFQAAPELPVREAAIRQQTLVIR